MSDNAILQELRGLRGDVSQLTVQQAVLTERVDHAIGRIDEHIASDDTVHSELKKRVTGLEHWRTRVLAIVAVLSTGVTLVAVAAREAIAKLF